MENDTTYDKVIPRSNQDSQLSTKKKTRDEQLEIEIKRQFQQKKRALAVLNLEKALVDTVEHQALLGTFNVYKKVQQKLYEDRPPTTQKSFSSFTQYSLQEEKEQDLTQNFRNSTLESLDSR